MGSVKRRALLSPLAAWFVACGGIDGGSEPGDGDGSGGAVDASIAGDGAVGEDVRIVTVGGFAHADIQAAFAQAEAGDVILFPPGTYSLEVDAAGDVDRLAFPSGVAVVGDPDGPVPILRFDGAHQATWRTAGTAEAPMSGITIRRLRFENVGLSFQGDAALGSDGIHVADLELADGLMDGAAASSNDWTTHYLSFRFVRNATVERCTLERRDAAHGGRGIYFYRVVNGVILDSFIGTTRDLPRTLGYFKTAVNVNGRSTTGLSDSIKSVGNTYHRTNNVCGFTGGEIDPCQDHAWYSWGARGVEFLENRVDGWENNESGAVKMRNSSEMFVERNHLRTSGLMFHLYPADDKPEVFERTVVRQNRIDLGGVASTRGAIQYSRDNANGGWQSSDPGFEADNNFVDNSLPGGGDIVLARGRGDGFCVAGNGLAPKMVDMYGSVRSSGCDADAGWDHPLRGVYRGDFDGDGAADFIHIGLDRAGDDVWIVHRRDPSGHHAVVEEWPAPDGFRPSTAAYGGHVGDFDGDGAADDFVFLGGCGGAACWRMYLGTGGGFAPGAAWSTTIGYSSAETLAYGVHVGDFDGDGRDDLAYRGTCAGADCWVVQHSQATGFAKESWGDGFYASPETETYGVKVGDFDGDGRDDILYRGYVGSADPAWRAQLSQGSSFSAADWGDGSAFTWESAHFGLEVADIDGDGRTDVGYMATCGTGSPRRWRNLLSTGSGFTVSCSTTNRFP